MRGRTEARRAPSRAPTGVQPRHTFDQRTPRRRPTFTQSVRKEAEGIISLDLNPPHWFFVGVLENAGLQKSSDQYGYVQRLRALIRYKHRHYLGKYAV